MMTTDDEIDFVSAPYETDKPNLFEGSEDHQTFFRTATRFVAVLYGYIFQIGIFRIRSSSPDRSWSTTC